MDITVTAAALVGLGIGVAIGQALYASALQQVQTAEEPPAAVSYNDPQRDPNYCWTHQMIWPACKDMHRGGRVSYRHSSYRKLSKAVKKASRPDGLPPDLARHEMDRVMHWSNRPPLPKPPGWGKPKAKRAA